MLAPFFMHIYLFAPIYNEQEGAMMKKILILPVVF